MSRPSQSHDRLVKVLLPSSFFVDLAFRRSPAQALPARKGIFIGPSPPKGEGERIRAERRAGSYSLTNSSTSRTQNVLSIQNVLLTYRNVESVAKDRCSLSRRSAKSLNK